MQLRVNSDLVSRKHCEFFVHDGKWAVRDLESRNGTFVNGKRTNEAGVFVGNGSTVQLGNERKSPVIQVGIVAASTGADDTSLGGMLLDEIDTGEA